MAPCVGGGRGEGGHEACHKPEAGSREFVERDHDVSVVVSPRKLGELRFRANRCSRRLPRIREMTRHGCSAKEDRGLQLVGHLCLPGSSQNSSPQEPAPVLALILAGEEREMREEWYKALP